MPTVSYHVAKKTKMLPSDYDLIAVCYDRTPEITKKYGIVDFEFEIPSGLGAEEEQNLCIAYMSELASGAGFKPGEFVQYATIKGF
jgi:hypothetical protein